VHRIITDLAVFDIRPAGLVLVETAPGVSESDVREATGADFTVALETAVR
jgi:3-oxoacid CoA-transferase subunit B